MSLSRRMLEKSLAAERKKAEHPADGKCQHCKRKDLLIAELRLQLRLTPRAAREKATQYVRGLRA